MGELIALDAVFKFLAALLKNKWFWFAVIAVIIYLVIRKNWANLLTWSAPSYVEPDTDANGNKIPISAERAKVLRGLANSLQSELHSWHGIGWYQSGLDLLANANNCTDKELKYLADFYEKVVNKVERTSLHEDLSSAFLPNTDLDNKLIARLQQMGLI